MADLINNGIISDIKSILFATRERVAKSVNNELVFAYWNIGRLIVEYEAVNEIGDVEDITVTSQLSKELTKELGKGFSRSNLFNMKRLFQKYPKIQTLSGLSWSHY